MRDDLDMRATFTATFAAPTHVLRIYVAQHNLLVATRSSALCVCVCVWCHHIAHMSGEQFSW